MKDQFSPEVVWDEGINQPAMRLSSVARGLHATPLDMLRRAIAARASCRNQAERRSFGAELPKRLPDNVAGEMPDPALGLLAICQIVRNRKVRERYKSAFGLFSSRATTDPGPTGIDVGFCDDDEIIVPRRVRQKQAVIAASGKSSRFGTIDLREWQHREMWTLISISRQGDRALVYACPGSGKTILALATVIRIRELLRDAGKPVPPILVLSPRLEIKSAWMRVAKTMGLELIVVNDKQPLLERDMHADGHAMSYQQASNKIEVLRHYCQTYHPLVILDEIHHTARNMNFRSGNVWGEAIASALAACQFKLALTGTPFREGPNPIAFVDYDSDGKVIAHVKYSYRDAVKSSVCRPIAFYSWNGSINWTERNGSVVEATFDTPLSKSRSRDRLRAALSTQGEFPRDIIKAAHVKLLEVRAETGGEDAGGLIVCQGRTHADEIAAALLEVTGQEPVIVHEEIDDAIEKIEEFRTGNSYWIIGIQMLSEGVDIPRLRVGVYCTNINTKLYFHQFCGRVIRNPSGRLEYAHVFFPDDENLRVMAEEIMEDVYHALGEDTLPAHREGRESPKVRKITVNESRAEHNSTIVDGTRLPTEWLIAHEEAIRSAFQHLPHGANMTHLDVALFLLRRGELPPPVEEASDCDQEKGGKGNAGD